MRRLENNSKKPNTANTKILSCTGSMQFQVLQVNHNACFIIRDPKGENATVILLQWILSIFSGIISTVLLLTKKPSN